MPTAESQPDPFALTQEIAPGIYPSMSMAAYLASPAVSSSVIKTMVERCGHAAWFASWLNPNRRDDPNKASDIGTIAHAILLEGGVDCAASVCTAIDPNDHPAEKTGNIPDGFTNKSIRAARDAVRAQGKVPLLLSDFRAACAMTKAAERYIASLRTIEPAIWQAFQPDGGDSELTGVWRDGPTLCRIRPDRMSRDRSLTVHVKTTKASAEPDSWGRYQLSRMGYKMTAAFYQRGTAAVFGVENSAHVFLVIEQDPPHLCSLVGIDPAGFALAHEKVASGLRDWQRCAAANHWPGYPPRVAYVETPPWEQAQWQERQIGAASGGDWRALFPELAEQVNA